MNAADDATARLGATEIDTATDPATRPRPASQDGAAPGAAASAGAAIPRAGPRWRGARLRRSVRLPHQLTVEQVLWLFLLAGGAALRLLSLDAVPLTQGEGTRALQSLGAAQLRSGGFSAWPGGLTDAATALIFKVLGAGDVAARVTPAIAGVLLVASFWLLRPNLGRGATFAAAALATVSPIFVVTARSSGGESLGAALAILLVASALHCVERPTTRRVAVIAALAVFGLGTDALYLGLIVPFVGWLIARGAWAHDPAVLSAWTRVRRWRIWLPSAAPLCLAALLLTVSRFGFGFTRLQPGATAEWALAFKALPHSPPWHGLFDVLVGYELPLLLVGAAGCWLVLRRRLWRRIPIAGLLVVWLASGVLLDLLMQARQPSTLLLTALPLALLGGVAINQLVRSFVEGAPELIDALFAVGVLAALAFCLISANLNMQLALFGDVGRIWFGLLLVAVCLAGAIYRARQDGAGTAALTVAALGLAGIVFSLHGAASAAFGTGDEFITGQRTTREGVALARLLVKNGGGVSTVTDDSLLPLAWYLRDTVRSGGNPENARLIPAGAKPPAGFTLSGNPATVSVRWTPSSWSAHGMVRWWVFREAWGPQDVVGVQLVVSQ